jgi:hypothetical protein
VTTQLKIVQNSATDIAASWKSSLKPLDTKLQGLVRLLENYGLLSSEEQEGASTMTLRRLLVQYILSGHTRTAPNLSNAVDQFFTGVHMNDQLIQRMERSLSVSVANVEVQFRRQVLKPAQALVYQASHLHGLARHIVQQQEHTDDCLLSASDARRFQAICEILLMSAETTVTTLVDARFRLRDLIDWLRSTGAQIKARGTAPQSARRDHAKKRRVPNAVVQRMLRYLQKDNSAGSTSTTEDILDLQFIQFLEEEPAFVEISRQSDLPTSPHSVLSSQPCDTPKISKTPTIPYVLERARQAAEVVFSGPQSYLEKRVSSTQIVLPSDGSVAAMTTRQGCGNIDPHSTLIGEPAPDGFYCPNSSAAKPQVPSARQFRQWTILAQAAGPDDNHLLVRLYAIPLHWTRAGIAAPFVWTAGLKLPPHYDQVLDVSFYGDDGKSSLSSGSDSGTGKEESRQPALALLLRRPSLPTPVTELWLVPYDDLVLDALPITENKDAASSFSLPAIPLSDCVWAKARVDDDDDAPDSAVVYARTRSVGAATTGRMVLSGPRGMAAVLGQQQGGTLLELFDLEEDVEDEDEMEEEE